MLNRRDVDKATTLYQLKFLGDFIKANAIRCDDMSSIATEIELLETNNNVVKLLEFEFSIAHHDYINSEYPDLIFSTLICGMSNLLLNKFLLAKTNYQCHKIYYIEEPKSMAAILIREKFNAKSE